MPEIITIISSVGVSSALSMALLFLLRNWISERLKASIQHEYDQKIKGIEHEYNQKLETHKAQLQSESDILIEKLKSKLHTTASARNIKLTQVFETQAEIIAKTYEFLYTLKKALEQLTYSNAEQMEKAGQDFRKRFDEFQSYYNPRKLYFPTATQDSVQGIVDSLAAKGLLININYIVNKSIHTDFNEDAQNFLEKKFPALFGNLDSEFKKILGLDENK